jgi:NADH dehydrogenase [ubiquinone] 1 alpha subcomplex assembly factor 7
MRNFPEMARAIDVIYMVEASPRLREAQKDRLCGPDAPMVESKSGYHSVCKNTNLPIVWTETIKSIPISNDKMPFIVAHEFFDALPIHAFQSVEVPPTGPVVLGADARPARPKFEWRELLVSTAPPSPPATSPLLATHMNSDLYLPSSPPSPLSLNPEFNLVLSRTSTRHSQLLPESSPRYRRLRSTPAALIEICPDAWLHASDFAVRIGGSKSHPKPVPAGAALVVDYGMPDTVPVNSLRGIRRHRRVSPFAAPGMVDLSTDVDFAALADAATRASEGIEVHGPTCQADFLESMGIMQRAEALARQTLARGNDADAHAITSACKRLVDRGPGGMGKVYHALAILPENSGRRRPVGFGGNI